MSNSLASQHRAGRIAVSPRARRAFARRNLDAELLRDIRGSGPDGRIVEADVARFSPDAAPLLSEVAQSPNNLAQSPNNPAQSLREVVQPPRGVAALFLRAELDATALVEYTRKAAAYADKSGFQIAAADVVLWAFCTALRETSAATKDVAVLRDDAPPYLIRGATHLGLPALARYSSEESPANAALTFHETRNTAIDEVCPPLAAGQTMALGVGAIKPRAFVVNGELAVRPTLRLCLAADTNALNGGDAARFLGVLVELLQEPEAMTFRGV